MGRLQLDMFEAEEAELFPAAPVVFRPDADRVRRRLARILAEARAAQTMPWDESQLRLYEKVLPQMSLALPEEEATQFRLAFEEELKRFGGVAAGPTTIGLRAFGAREGPPDLRPMHLAACGGPAASGSSPAFEACR